MYIYIYIYIYILLQTQQVMTSQISSHIKCLLQTSDLLCSCVHFVVEGDEKSSLNGGF